MVKKDLQVGDRIKIMKVTMVNNLAGVVEKEMNNCVGKTFVITSFSAGCPGVDYQEWGPDALYFDPRDVRRIRKANTKPADGKVAKPAVTVLEKLIKQCKLKGGVGLCSFAMEYPGGRIREYVSAPCHAMVMGNGGASTIALAMYDYLEKSPYPDAYKLHVKYIIQDSPWAYLFREKDVDEILKSGVTLNTDTPCGNIMGGCVSLREGNEYSMHLPIFKDLLDAGFSGHTAYVVSRGFRGDLKTPDYIGISNAHKVLSPFMDVEMLAKFFAKGYDERKESYLKGHSEYGIAEHIAKDSERNTLTNFFLKSFKVETKRGAFGNENHTVVNTDCVLDLCNRFEAKISEWKVK